MKIVHVTSTDPAGSVINFVNATNFYTKHRARLITTVFNEYQFAQDIGNIYDCGDEIEALLREADVIHLHKVADNFTVEVNIEKRAIQRKFCVADVLKAVPGKKVVHHIHGHPYERANPQENGERYNATGRFVLASTPDLELMYAPFCPRVRYFPNCVPVNDVRYLPRASDKKIILVNGEERYCIAQAPTHAILKNVHVIEDAVKELGATFPVFYLKISKMVHDEALRHKRNAHVVFDHLEGYYGLSSLEAMSQGKPTIAGLSDYTRQAISEFFGVAQGRLPWMLAHNKEQVKEAIVKLVENDEYRRHVGIESRKFMEEVWSDRAIAERLAAFYESL